MSTLKRKKKAYLLIELCIYLGALGIITLILTKNLIFYVKEYKSFISEEKELNYILNAEMYLDYRFLNSRIENIIINENKDFINIKFWENGMILEDKIEKLKNGVSITFNRYGEYYSRSLLDGVEIFDVLDKENLFYIKLKVKGQEEKVYCYEK